MAATKKSYENVLLRTQLASVFSIFVFLCHVPGKTAVELRLRHGGNDLHLFSAGRKMRNMKTTDQGRPGIRMLEHRTWENRRFRSFLVMTTERLHPGRIMRPAWGITVSTWQAWIEMATWIASRLITEKGASRSCLARARVLLSRRSLRPGGCGPTRENGCGSPSESVPAEKRFQESRLRLLIAGSLGGIFTEPGGNAVAAQLLDLFPQ